MLEKRERYTPAEAKRVNAQLDRLVADKALTARQAGAHRRHVASRVRVALKESYSERAARRAKTEIVTLTKTGAITPNAARAYRAHVTKRTTTI